MADQFRAAARGGSGGFPVACDLSALDDAQRRRRALLAELLQVGVVEVVELSTGYALRIAPDSVVARDLEELVALEGLCCPFLTFAIRRAPESRGPVLEITGDEGVKAFVAAALGIGYSG